MERNEIMIRLLWAGSVHTRYFLRRYMPTNILLDAIRTPRGLKWGVPAMLLAIPYFLIAAILVQVINDGGPAWLNEIGRASCRERVAISGVSGCCKRIGIAIVDP